MRMDASDEDLALAAAGGDRAAFSVLVERVYDRVFGLCFRLTGSRADAEDLTQDICAALPGKLDSFRGQSRLTTWLYRVTVNAVHDWRRRVATHARHADGWGDVERARRADAQEAAEAQDWLMQAMRALGPDLRDTVVLVIEGLSHAEVAEALDVSEGTVSWRMSDAKRRLREVKEAEE